MSIECPGCSQTTCRYCEECGLCFHCCECGPKDPADEVDPDLQRWRDTAPDNGWELGPHVSRPLFMVAA